MTYMSEKHVLRAGDILDFLLLSSISVSVCIAKIWVVVASGNRDQDYQGIGLAIRFHNKQYRFFLGVYGPILCIIQVAFSLQMSV
jgi:hypothetical protein